MNWAVKVNKLFQTLAFSASCLLLGGCQTISGWADSVGSHMPVIGERCEHWQCITGSGQAESDAIKAQQTEMEGAISDNESDEDAEEKPDASSFDAKRPNVFTEERPPIIPPSTESGVPEVEQRGSRKPFPKQF